jgi:hypothetical protein
MEIRVIVLYKTVTILITTKDEGIAFVLNLGNNIPENKAPHSRTKKQQRSIRHFDEIRILGY